MSTFEKIAKMIAEAQGMDVAEIKEDSAFADLGLDSLSTVELVMQMEDEFGVSIEVDENLKTVADVIKVIEEGK